MDKYYWYSFTYQWNNMYGEATTNNVFVGLADKNIKLKDIEQAKKHQTAIFMGATFLGLMTREEFNEDK